MITHRIELQEKERDLLEAYITLGGLKDVAHSIIYFMAALGIGLAGYGAYWVCKEGWGFGTKAADAISEWTGNVGGAEHESGKVSLWEFFVGKPTETFNGRTYTNPFAGWPILGPAFGAGIAIGTGHPGSSNPRNQTPPIDYDELNRRMAKIIPGWYDMTPEERAERIRQHLPAMFR